jgi:hypothetical protein
LEVLKVQAVLLRAAYHAKNFDPDKIIKTDVEQAEVVGPHNVAEIKERLAKVKEFFDAHPHPGLIGQNG